ncbi:DUF1501 domain-containing protein [bacterium]|nr:DUF1501 domain-containing protein [bacterium]
MIPNRWSCMPMNRRRALVQVGALGAFGVRLADVLSGRANAIEPSPVKSVVLLWLWGGPSHLDTFDMKPNAPLEYRGPFEPIATRVPGVNFCELLPGLAQSADKLAVIRSMHHTSNDHGVAGTIALTGSEAGAVALGGAVSTGAMRPSIGSIIGRLSPRPSDQLPAYVILGSQLHQGLKKVVGEGGGLLGSTHDPFRLDYDPIDGLKIPSLDLPVELSAERLDRRFEMLRHSRDVSASIASSGRSVASIDRHYDLAHTLLTSRQTMKALDLTSETSEIRAAYGRHRFGQCCLLARRLVEAGQPVVQVNWSTHVECPEDAGDGGWDMHDRYFQIMQDRHGWMFDKAMTALVRDLDQRRLLDSTLIVAVGEFGRTPKINPKAGRDHWNPCYSALLAGGGIRGGAVIGASDKHGEYPKDRPVTPADLGATILSRLGVTASDLTGLGLLPQGEPIAELF